MWCVQYVSVVNCLSCPIPKPLFYIFFHNKSLKRLMDLWKSFLATEKQKNKLKRPNEFKKNWKPCSVPGTPPSPRQFRFQTCPQYPWKQSKLNEFCWQLLIFRPKTVNNANDSWLTWRCACGDHCPWCGAGRTGCLAGSCPGSPAHVAVETNNNKLGQN